MEPKDFDMDREKILNMYGQFMFGGNLEETVKKYVDDWETPKEAEIHAERSKKFVKGNHIVSPFNVEEAEEEEVTMPHVINEYRRLLSNRDDAWR